MKKRIRRTMMFLPAQNASLLKDAYIYKPDCVIFDLEDAVAENQKDAARFTLFHTLKNIDYKGIELVVRVNGLDSPHIKEDIRAAVAGGIEVIRVPKCERKADIEKAEKLIEEAEREFGVKVGSTMIMAAIESPLGIINAYEICTSSQRMMGVAVGAGDLMRTLQTKRYPDGMEMFGARSQLIIAARAAGIMCFDTVNTDLSDWESFRREVELIKQLGFDGKSVISPKQIPIVHEVFAPTEEEIRTAEKTIISLGEFKEEGKGVFTIDGQMVDIAMLEGAQRIIATAKACGIYRGDL